MTVLGNEVPHSLKPILCSSFGPLHCIQRRFSSLNIGVPGFHELRSFEGFPEEVQTKIDGDSDVSREEVADIKAFGWRWEYPEPVEKGDDGKEYKTKPSCIWLKGGFEDEAVSIDALGFQCSFESKIRNCHRHPSEEDSNSDEILKPGKHSAGTFAARHICEK